MINSIIIDDETHAIEGLRYELNEHCPNVNIVAVCNNPEKAVKMIAQYKPDLVFLDIEMPWMNGFEVLKQVEDINFEVIFVTAYDQYAIKAFKFSAIDYLLKPVDGTQLKAAIDKLIKRNSKFDQNHFNALLENLSTQKNRLEKLVLPTSEGLEFVEVKDIVRCSSDSNYCSVILSDGKEIFLAKTLKEIESLLLQHDFIRIHQSHLIAEQYIKRYVSAEGGMIEMKDGSKVPISRSKKSEFLKRFKLT